MTAPHYIRRVVNDMEKAPHGWPEHFEVLDALDRYVTRWGFNAARDGSESETRALERAQESRKRADWFAALPVGQRKGGFLETARTVRSRALDALGYVQRDSQGLPRKDKYTAEERDIVTDLEAVVARLDNWKRTGKTPKYPGGSE